MSLSLGKKVTLLVSVPVVLEVIMVGSLTFVLTKVETARARAAHANKLSADVNTLMSGQLRSLTMQLVRRMTNLQTRSAEELALMDSHSRLLEHLREETDRNPSEKKMWDEIIRLGIGIDNSFDAARKAYDRGDKVGAGIAGSGAQNDLNKLMRIVNSMGWMQMLTRRKVSESMNLMETN